GDVSRGIRARSARSKSGRAGRQSTMPTAPPTETQPSVEAHVFWLRYQKQIAVALVIIVLGMIGFAGYRFFQNRRNDSAAEALGGAKSQHDYEQVIEQYSGTPAGASAYLLLAQKQREE